jgi:hypothetical protein
MPETRIMSPVVYSEEVSVPQDINENAIMKVITGMAADLILFSLQ